MKVNVWHFAINFEEVHKISLKSINHKERNFKFWRNVIFKYQYKQHFTDACYWCHLLASH